VPFASGLSEHPVAALAVGEAVGQVLDVLDTSPDLVVVFVTAPHVGAIDDIAAAVRDLLRPEVLLGVTASSVVGGAREIEEQPAISLWAASIGPVVPLRLATVPTSGGWAVTGFPTDATTSPHSLLLLADPFSFPAEGLLSQLEVSAPDLTVIGGLASAARGPGGNRLVLDGRAVTADTTPGGETVFTDGAVGVLLPGPDRITTVVSQGCRPIGDPYVVTRGEGNVVHELGGRPAVERLEAIVNALDPAERDLVAHGLHVGRVIDEHHAEFGRGDFLIRNLAGLDRDRGAIAVGDNVEVGSTLQFQVRDAQSADEDLRALLAEHDGDGALLFTCNGRGTNLFDRPDHDAEVVSEAIDGRPTAGMFCAGELGPVGGRNFLHGFTASIALFHEPDEVGA
jgi:small ligand-binding sensory domain FIST